MAEDRPRVRDWQQIQPGEAYDADDVATLFKVSAATVSLWARSRKLMPLPRMSARQPYRFLGSVLLAQLGDQAASLRPAVGV